MDTFPLRPSPPSRASTRSSKTSLSLDLSNIPPLIQPAKPTNVLIFTGLDDLDIFAADNLQTIRSAIENIAPIHSFSPLKSLKRIQVIFHDAEAAIKVRQKWDGENVLGVICRVYFGHPYNIEAAQKDPHLALPDAGKLFFISPPPSPPHGWEMKLEDAPNTMVHAEDLAEALAKLRHHNGPTSGSYSPISPADSSRVGGGPGFKTRSRSSTLIFQPEPPIAGGESPNLPCVTVDDMTDEPGDMSPVLATPEPKPIMAHTARPPVELMHHS
ncbi:putative calcineurin binding protein [Naviculisporaceae sp. PSN 640]